MSHRENVTTENSSPRNEFATELSSGVREAAQGFLYEEARSKVTTEMVAEAMRIWDERMKAGEHDWPGMLTAVYAAMKLKDPIHQLLPKHLTDEHMRIYLAGIEMGMEHAHRFEQFTRGEQDGEA